MKRTPISAEPEATAIRPINVSPDDLDTCKQPAAYEQLIALIERAHMIERARETKQARKTKPPVNLDEFDLPPSAAPPSIFDWDVPPDA